MYKGKAELGSVLRLAVILKPERCKISRKRPLRVQENGGFLVDRSNQGDPRDWLITDLGSFTNLSYSARLLKVADGNVVEDTKLPKKRSAFPHLDENSYIVVTQYWKHSKYPDFRRVTTTVLANKVSRERFEKAIVNSSISTELNGNVEMTLGLVEYFFTGNEHTVSPKKHGKTGKPFYQVAQSTKDHLKRQASTRARPTAIFDRTYQNSGDSLHIESFGDVPRNIQQIKSMRKRIRSDEKEPDKYVKLIDIRKSSSMWRLEFKPSPYCLYCPEWLLKEIADECCKPESTSIFALDTTYGVGDFYVTPTNYRSTKVYHAGNEKPVFLPGPCMFHCSMDAENFLSFAHGCLERNSAFEKLRFVGGDRDSSQKSFMKPLKGVTFLPCIKHIKDDIRREMEKLNCPLDADEVINDIFGNERLQLRGLADSMTAEEFREKVYQREGLWGEDFHHYFNVFLADDICRGMLLPLRRSLGLGDDYFYNNAAESLNNKYKQQIREKYDESGAGTAAVSI